MDENGFKTTTNQQTDGRFDTNWLNMIYPRLIIAKQLLKKDGVIFISIDDNEQARLKLLCDEIFGESNFLGNIIWLRNPGGESDNKFFANTKDYILVYTKNKNNFELKPLLKEMNILDFKQNNSQVFKKGGMLEKSGENDRLIDRPNLGYVVYFKKDNNEIKIQYDYKNGKINERLTLEDKIYHFDDELINKGYEPIIPRFIKNTYGRWRMGSEKLTNLFNENKIIFEKDKSGKYKIYEKIIYEIFDPYKKMQPKDFISFTTNSSGTNELKELFDILPFTKPKPISLIKYLVNLHTNKNALILDFFAGSGSTDHAVMDLNKEDDGNRKFILVQLDEKIENNNEFKLISDITRERINRAINKYEYKNEGYKFFKCKSSNIINWNSQNNNEQLSLESINFEEILKEDRSYLDLVYEIGLTMGMKLDSQIEQFDFYFYNKENNMIFLFSNKNYFYQIDEIHKIIKNYYELNSDNLQIYLLDCKFKNDEDKLNCLTQIEDISDQIKIVVV